MRHYRVEVSPSATFFSSDLTAAVPENSSAYTGLNMISARCLRARRAVVAGIPGAGVAAEDRAGQEGVGA